MPSKRPEEDPQTGTGAEAPAQLCPMTIDPLLQRYGHGVARELVAEGETRDPKFVLPIYKAAAWGGAAGCGKGVVMPLLTKIDIQRFRAEQPADIVDKLDAATDYPARPEVIVSLAKWGRRD